MKKNKTLKNLKKTLQKLQKTQKALNKFIIQTTKNYNTMKATIKKIWLCAVLGTACTAYNVTRVITNESQYYQKGDTAVTIQTKTIKSYNAIKNN